MKTVIVIAVLLAIAFVVVTVVRKRKANKAKRVTSNLGTSTYQSKAIDNSAPSTYSGEVYLRRPAPYGRTSEGKSPKPKKESSYGYAESADMPDTNWYSEPTYQAPVVDYGSSDRGSYTAPSTDSSSSSSGSSYGGSSDNSSNYSSGSSSDSSSSSSDSGSY